MYPPLADLKLTDALRGEHGAFYTLFDLIEGMATEENQVMARIQGAITVLTAMVDAHATLEEELLFPALEPLLGKDSGPLAVMLREHEEMEQRLMDLEGAVGIDEALALAQQALDTARSHFQKEERVLFPLAERLLGEKKLVELGKTWADRRKVTIE